MGKKGFSLLELVMVIAITGVSTMGLVAVMRQAVVNMHKPQIMATATALASGEIEKIMLRPFAAINTQATANFTGNFSAYSYGVTVIPHGSDNKEVVVSVSHPVIGSLQLRVLRTNF